MLYLLTLAIGFILGALGGGGAILMLPILTYLAGLTPSQAIPVSLAIIGTSSLVSVAHNLPCKTINWQAGIIFGASGMAGAYAGGILSNYLPDSLKMMLFACIMLTSAYRMLTPRSASIRIKPWPRPIMVAVGMSIGVLSGLLGAGGGFLLMPALVLGLGLPMVQASATSLFVIALQTLTALTAHLTHTSINWAFTLTLTAITIIDMLAGLTLARRLPDKMLRKGFGLLIIVIAVFTLGQEVLPVLSH